MSPKVLQLDPRDNVLVALANLGNGEVVSNAGESFRLSFDVPAKHKFVTHEIAAGGEIIMYGVLVGRASKAIHQGELLTTSNVRHAAAAFHNKTETYDWSAPDVSRWRPREFLGYHRSDGQVGTRNYWLVVPLVFCENRNLQVLQDAFEEELGFVAPPVYRRQVAELVRLFSEGKSPESHTMELAAADRPQRARRIFANIDGIRFLRHEGGCGGTREDTNNLCGLLAGYIHHPNVAGATGLSLGCQHAQIGILREELRKRNPNFDKPLVIVEQQQSGTEAAMLTEAIRDTV